MIGSSYAGKESLAYSGRCPAVYCAYRDAIANAYPSRLALGCLLVGTTFMPCTSSTSLLGKICLPTGWDGPAYEQLYLAARVPPKRHPPIGAVSSQIGDILQLLGSPLARRARDQESPADRGGTPMTIRTWRPGRIGSRVARPSQRAFACRESLWNVRIAESNLTLFRAAGYARPAGIRPIAAKVRH